MHVGVDFERLRSLLEQPIEEMAVSGTHASLPALCASLGLPEPPAEQYHPAPDRIERRSKRERVRSSLSELVDAGVPEVAENVLLQGVGATLRNAVQDLLWAAEDGPEIPKRVRREISQDLDFDGHLRYADKFVDLLGRLWVLDDHPLAGFGEPRHGLRSQIWQHFIRNPEDWSTEDLFENVGAFEASNRRFALFLEGLVSSDVLPDAEAQERFVGAVNPCLQPAGAELRQVGVVDGYPHFEIVSTRAGRNRRPKNLIFASPRKPDLRFRSAVDNDIEVVEDQEAVLVYDRPIETGRGLRWCDLQSWWMQSHPSQDFDEAKALLYKRLRDSLPRSSPPQIMLFDLYHSIFAHAIVNLPALLPEVWLHWDPKTVAERGPRALMRFRMDYLMLLPGGHRVVLEVDGVQHYSDGQGRADVHRYAEGMGADRELKLAGYEVFRFGGSELQKKADASVMLREFFVQLFRRYGVVVS